MNSLRNKSWQLPDGMDELMPGRALVLEQLRRRLYDLHIGCGYQPVHPPFIEYLESLLSRAGQDSDRHTFRIADPASGRMMGLRADMTPQVARIDAHALGGSGVRRLFYMGTVIRAYGDGGNGNRSPLQMGAEIFGHAGIESDVEVIRLMLSSIASAGVTDVHLDLGHVEIFRSLVEKLQLAEIDQTSLFGLLQRKAESDLRQLSSSLGINPTDSNILCELCSLNGDQSVLQRATKLLGSYGDTMLQAIDSLRVIGEALQSVAPQVVIHYDLAEVRGYQYHNGVVFAAYVPQSGSEIARGGRYDGIGEIFGNERPATGYSTDLKTLMNLGSVSVQKTSTNYILAPANGSTEAGTKLLQREVESLRSAGEVVITALSDEETLQCGRQLVEKDGRWLLENR